MSLSKNKARQELEDSMREFAKSMGLKNNSTCLLGWAFIIEDQKTGKEYEFTDENTNE